MARLLRYPLAAARSASVVPGVLLFAALCVACEVRPIDPQTGRAIIGGDEEVADAAALAEGLWDERVLPAVRDDALDLVELLPALAADSESASERYGHREGTRPYSFLVRGTGRVVAVDTSSRVGRARIDLPPFDGQPDVSLQIGPVLRGTALRDALPFISFDQFVNQLEYAAVSQRMHRRITETLLRDLDRGALPGTTLSFHGAFSYDGGEPLITPVILIREPAEP
jgi:predicted lipoprotein